MGARTQRALCLSIWRRRAWVRGPPALSHCTQTGPQGRRVWGEAGLEEVGAGAEPPLPQALCPGDSPLHKDLPGPLVVHELFSSVLQEISDEVSGGGQDGLGTGREVVEHARINLGLAGGRSVGMRR